MRDDYRTVEEARDEIRLALQRARTNTGIRLAMLMWLTGVLIALALTMVVTDWIDEPFTDIVQAAVLAGAGVSAIALAWYVIRRQWQMQKLEILQLQKAKADSWRTRFRDSLTQLYDRRYFYERLEEELALSQLVDRPLALLVCDIRDLKGIVDTYGHTMGDLALKHVADRLRSGSRASDVVARIARDQFAVLLPGTDRKRAERVKARLKQDMAINGTVKYGSQHLSVATEFGVAAFPGDGLSIEDLFNNASGKKRTAKAKARMVKRGRAMDEKETSGQVSR